MNLVIVESPHKSKTIEKYLGKNYKVVSSVGHIRDLATTGKYGLGVDIDNDFKPSYIPITGKKKVISNLKKAVKESDKVYLATDPDREGEAISWHLKDTLNLKENNYARILFHEITKDKVIEAFNQPGKIDDHLVKSQETRRILDRIIGFRLSKLIQSKTSAKSAGRVQSVALKLIVDREREIQAFVSEEYYTITGVFDDFEADLFNYNHQDLEIKDLKTAEAILEKLSKQFKIISIEKKTKKKNAKYPFTTSTLQIDASQKLGFSAKKTMTIAQKLYEGITLENETVGLITYMRTDSIRLSDEFIGQTMNYIDKHYGKNYVGYVKKAKNTENVQDAHEAVRPTSILREPDEIKGYLSPDEYKLYKLIYTRSLASLMADAKTDNTTIILDNNNYQFKATGQILIFDGYLKVYSDYEDSEDRILPDLEVNKILNSNDIFYEQHFTKPPVRYTEAKLIKELEELGIGRPSTYAKIMDIIRERDYVITEDKKFIPTEIGIELTDKLQEFFSNIINVKYTADMENDLDKIADGKIDNIRVLKDFYTIFEPTLNSAFKEMEKPAPTETGENCPNCGSPLVVRKGKYGEFVACSNYPTCKYVKKEAKEIKYIMDCPLCDGKVIEKTTRKGKIFYGCNNYPKCTFATWDEPTNEFCPKCQSVLVKKDHHLKCSKCDYQSE